MVEDFAPLQQPLGSNSCLSTAIASILIYLNCTDIDTDSPQKTVSEWCSEDPLGCVPDLAIEGLRDHGWFMQQLKSDPENEMWSLVNAEDDPTPVIACVKFEATQDTPPMDHAVVVLGREIDNDGSDIVHLMDPMFGEVKETPTSPFLKHWDLAYQAAFVISE